MACCVIPVSSIWRKRNSGYNPLFEDEDQEQEHDYVFKLGGDSEKMVRVIVGQEKTEFFVDPFVLKVSPFRFLIDNAERKKDGGVKGRDNRVILVNVDAILFEHMLWLMKNDCPSLFRLNLEEIIDFYAQDY